MTAETKSISKLSSSLSEYLDDKQLEQVKKAFFYASNAHSGQFRSSGDPYVSHPIAVAKILADFKMDCLLYTSPSPRDLSTSRMPSSA